MLEKIFGKTINSVKLRRFFEFIQPHGFRMYADDETNVGKIILVTAYFDVLLTATSVICNISFSSVRHVLV